MPQPEPTHIAFSDESHWNKGRFRGISLITMDSGNYSRLNSELKTIIEKRRADDFGFKKVDENKYRELAENLCDFAIRRAKSGEIRIDILTWDTSDARHNIQFRDDIRNFHIMYHQLYKNVLKKRWPDNATWLLCPDEQRQIDWEDLLGFLEGAGLETQLVKNQSGFVKYSLELKKRFKVLEICPLNSHQEPFIQLADLFAGIGVYSRENYDSIEQWLKHSNTQKTLIPGNESEIEVSELSRSQRQRNPLIISFNQKCKKIKLNVSLESYRGLKTLNPNKPINFWWYTPQHTSDKAPTTRQGCLY